MKIQIKKYNHLKKPFFNFLARNKDLKLMDAITIFALSCECHLLVLATFYKEKFGGKEIDKFIEELWEFYHDEID